MSLSKKCAVFDCVNETSEGTFIGDFCGPCHDAIYHGHISSDGHTNLWKGLSILQAAARTLGVALHGATKCPGPCCEPPRRPTIEPLLFTEEEERQLLTLHGDRVRPLLELAHAYKERATSEKPSPGECSMTREELICANVLLQKEVRMYLADGRRIRKERDKAATDLEEAKRALVQHERSIAGWKETASGHLNGMNYFRDLLDRIAQLIGPAAYIDDAGGHHTEPIRAKLPELVSAIAKVAGILRVQK
jgi:hypothetical protein